MAGSLEEEKRNISEQKAEQVIEVPEVKESTESPEAMQMRLLGEVSLRHDEFRAEDSKIETINTSLGLSPEEVQMEKAAMCLDQEIAGLNQQADAVVEDTKRMLSSREGYDLADMDIEIPSGGTDAPEGWEDDLSPSEKEYLEHARKMNALADKIREVMFLPPDDDTYPTKLKDVINQIDFEEIKSGLGSEFRYRIFEDLKSLELGMEGRSCEKAIRDAFGGGLAKIVSEDPRALSLENLKDDTNAVHELDEIVCNKKRYLLGAAVGGSVTALEMARPFISNESISKALDATVERNIRRMDVSNVLNNTGYQRPALAFVDRHGTPALRGQYIEAIQGKVRSGNENDARDVLNSESEFVSSVGEQIAKGDIREKFGIEDFPIDAWRGRDKNLKYNENLNAMNAVESVNQGGVKMLNEKYGIREFCRYPADVLNAQVQEEEVQQPYGVVVFPFADHNNAFDSFKNGFEKMYVDTRGRCGIKVAECGSKMDLARKLITLDDKYGHTNKISFLILGGHGGGSSLSLGEMEFTEEPRGMPEEARVTPENRAVIWNTEMNSPGFKKANEKFLDEDAEVLLLSCSTGEEGGIAEALSSSMQKKTLAPKTPVSRLDITISFDNKNKPHLKALFDQDAAISMEYGVEGDNKEE